MKILKWIKDHPKLVNAVGFTIGAAGVLILANKMETDRNRKLIEDIREVANQGDEA